MVPFPLRCDGKSEGSGQNFLPSTEIRWQSFSSKQLVHVIPLGIFHNGYPFLGVQKREKCLLKKKKKCGKNNKLYINIFVDSDRYGE